MTIEAKFIGKSSLEYETEKKYKLKAPDFGGMTIRKIDNTGEVFYHSISAFLRNWDEIRIL